MTRVKAINVFAPGVQRLKRVIVHRIASANTVTYRKHCTESLTVTSLIVSLLRENYVFPYVEKF